MLALTHRLLTHVAAGTTDQLDGTFTVPVSAYLDADRWQQEVDGIFRRVPLMVAMSCELPGPGTYKATEVVGVPLLVTRAADGVARAFLNVCRHRGALVTAQGCGEARRFTCPYHAWSYDGTGALVGLPGRETFGEVDTATLGLTELACEEVAGMVFATLTPGMPCDARGWLCGFDEVLAPFHLEDWVVFSRNELDGPNWKVAYDGYLEGYHFASLHRDTIFRTTMSNTMAYDAWGPHQRIGFAKHAIAGLRDKPEDEWGDFEGVDLVCTLFPNVSLAISPELVLVSQLSPGPTHDRSRTRQVILLPEAPATDKALARAERSAAFLYQVVQDEDYATGLGIQRGLTSGANAEFVFGRNEVGLQRFHRSVEAHLTSAS
jgi:nitrite reductase/ring-hydroxylating ferredoxin subunit